MTGNIGSDPTKPAFLLDESLVPNVARALSLVGYKFVDAVSIFGRRGVKDPELIDWCRTYEFTWVHADDRARKDHRVLLQASGIKTLLISRPRGHMTGQEQLRILAYVLPHLMEKWAESPSVRHYKATAASPTANPRLSRARMRRRSNRLGDTLT